MKLSYFPQVKVVHTSKHFHGQLFVPFANWLLMIGTVLIATLYKNVGSLLVTHMLAYANWHIRPPTWAMHTVFV